MRWWHVPVLALFVPFCIAMLPFALALFALQFVMSCVLLIVVWTTWLPRGKRALVVYSNSPVWQAYFEANVIPQLADQAVVLNWSERSEWRRSVAVMLFRRFAPRREFNPLVVLFRPYRWPRPFRFYNAFRAYKHGRPQQVEEALRQVYQAFGVHD